MKYFVTDRNDEVLGPFSPDEIRNLIASGKVEESALVCEEGAETWQPLESALPAVAVPVPSPQPEVKPPQEAAAKAVPAAAPKPEPEPKREVKPEPPREPAPQAKKEAPPAAVAPITRKPDASPARSGVNPVLVIGILVAFALLLYGAYLLGKRL